ncbi:unnamed protein product [Caenorhabditis nigoni]
MSFVERSLSHSNTNPAPTSILDERNLYERDGSLLGPLDYWPMTKSLYPMLAQMERWKVFAVPSTEADIERSFSILKSVYLSNRISLDMKLLENLMIVKESLF